MPLSVDLLIRQQLARYLMGEITLPEFQEWFAPMLWEIEETEDQLAVDRAYEIEQRLAEKSLGHWTEDELKIRLRPLTSPALHDGHQILSSND